MHSFKVAVVGAGTMGANLALVFAARGQAVFLTDEFSAQEARARETIRTNAEELRRNSLLALSADEVLARIQWCPTAADAAAEADWIVEAVTENLRVKQRLFQQIEAVCRAEVIICSNTSTLMPTQLAAGMVRPERLIVAHFWNPAHLIPLVEVVPHAGTGIEVVERTRAMLLSCGKQPVVINREVPGFVGNRLAFALQREAMALVEQGVVSPQEIDLIVQTGFGRRVVQTGVFGTADLGGLDVYLSICRLLFPHLCASTTPSPLLESLVQRGSLGLKAGAGWSAYSPAQAEALRTGLAKELIRYALKDAIGRS